MPTPIAHKLNVPVYFADSYCAWQKGAIENANKLIRQYIPKGTDISTVTERKIDKIRKKINARPREKLNFFDTKGGLFQKFFVMLHSLVDSADNYWLSTF